MFFVFRCSVSEILRFSSYAVSRWNDNLLEQKSLGVSSRWRCVKIEQDVIGCKYRAGGERQYLNLLKMFEFSKIENNSWKTKYVSGTSTDPCRIVDYSGEVFSHANRCFCFTALFFWPLLKYLSCFVGLLYAIRGVAWILVGLHQSRLFRHLGRYLLTFFF